MSGSTKGKAAWEKYFQGNGDVDTVVNKPADIFDLISQTKVIGNLPAGQKITYLSNAMYEPKPVIQYEIAGKKYKTRIKFDMMQKPGTRGSSDPTNVKTIKDKSLAPDGLGLGGKTILKRDYIKTVNTAIDACTVIAPHIKEFLKVFLEKSKTTNSTLSTATKDISGKDLAIIAKDFGEIAGAWWFLNNYDGDIASIEFPARSNEPLVDYYGVYGNKLKIGVSAKSGSGAAPSISSVWKMIGTRTFTDLNDRKVHDFIGAVVNNSGTEGIVKAAKAMNSPLYKTVGTLIGKLTYTADDIEAWMKKFKTAKDAHEFLTKNFYSKIGRSSPLTSFETIWSKPSSKRGGTILSPMAYALITEVNANKKNTEFLTDIVRANNIEQLYVNLSATTLKYELKGFRDSNFIFEYHSNAANPGGNKIGFILKK
jgi:hypothetical protein